MGLRHTAVVGLTLLVLGLSSMASAQPDKIGVPPVPMEHRPDPGQTPPQDKPSGPETKECIADHSTFRTVGKIEAYVIELRNACEQRFRCIVDAYVVTARGPAQARVTLTLGPASKAAAARKSHVVNVRSSGGMASVSRSCKTL